MAGAALARRTGQTRWRIVAGVMLGLACLVKPIVGVAMVPVVCLASLASVGQRTLGGVAP